MRVAGRRRARTTSGFTLRAEASSQAGDGVDEFRDSRVLDGEVAALAQDHQVGRTRCSRQNSGAELDWCPRVPTWVQQRHRRAVALGRGVCEPQVGGEKPQGDSGGAPTRIDRAQTRQCAIAAHPPQIRHSAHRDHGACQPSSGEHRQWPAQDA